MPVLPNDTSNAGANRRARRQLATAAPAQQIVVYHSKDSRERPPTQFVPCWRRRKILHSHPEKRPRRAGLHQVAAHFDTDEAARVWHTAVRRAERGNVNVQRCDAFSGRRSQATRFPESIHDSLTHAIGIDAKDEQERVNAHLADEHRRLRRTPLCVGTQWKQEDNHGGKQRT